MNAIPWKRLVPVFAALALFYALSLVYFSPMLEGKSLDQHDIRQWQGHGQGSGRAPRRHGRGSTVDRQHVQRHAGLPDLGRVDEQSAPLRRQALPRLPATSGQLPLPLSNGHVRAAADIESGSVALARGCHRLCLQQLLLRDPAGRAYQQGQRHRLHAHGAGRGVPVVPGAHAAGCRHAGPLPWVGSDDEPRAGDVLPRHPVGVVRIGGRHPCRAGKDRGRFRETVRLGRGGGRLGRALQPRCVVEYLGIR
jgi:hypothetical protein